MTPIDDTQSVEASGGLSLFDTAEDDEELLPIWFVGVPMCLALGRGLLTLVSVPGPINVGYDALLIAVAALATERLFSEAQRQSESRTDWTPNPWWYLVGGAIGVTALVLAGVADPATILERPTAVVGIFIVGLVCASTIAGPVFLLQLWRHRDDSTEATDSSSKDDTR